MCAVLLPPGVNPIALKYIPCTIGRRKDNWSGHTLCRDCPLKHVIEGKTDGMMEVKGRLGRRLKWLLDELKKRKDTMT
jgi:hypothetical protein